MAVRSRLDAAGVLEALRAAASTLEDHRAALDLLDLGDEWSGMDRDVPSVDGGDSELMTGPSGRGAGSELAAVLRAAADASQGCSSLGQLADVLAGVPEGDRAGDAATAMGAVLAGIGESLRNADEMDATRFAIGLELAAERLTAQDDGSHAGCFPAVLGAAADAALGAVDTGVGLADTIIAAADEGLAELESGPQANPDLVERGVVDAAAAGFVLVLDVLAGVVTGEPLPSPPAEPVASPGRSSHRYVVRCRIEPHDGNGLEAANWLESTWHELGELVHFDGAGSSWRAEVLTVVPGAAVEAIFDVGRPRELHIGITEASEAGTT